MAMLQEDADTLERLKAKWQPAADRAGSCQAIGEQPGSQGADSPANTRICQDCQGSGIQTEVYKFRRLEHTCTHCQGEGLLFLGARPARKTSSSTSTVSICNDQQPKKQDHTSSKQDKQHHNRKQRSSQAQLDKLQKKIDELSQEEADLQAALDTQDSSAKQQSLETALLQQLHSHLQQLKQQQRRITDSAT